MTLNNPLLPLHLIYRLTEKGQKALLLQGGNGFPRQRVCEQLQELPRILASFPPELNATLENVLELFSLNHKRELEFDIRGDEAVYSFDSRKIEHFLIPPFDNPLTFQEALLYHLEHESKRQIIIAAHAEEQKEKEAQKAILALKAEHEREVSAAQRAQEDQEKKEREQQKKDQIANWITEHGSSNQKERQLAGVLSDKEIIEEIKAATLAPVTKYASYERIESADVPCDCEEWGNERCRLTCLVLQLDTLTDKQWEDTKILSTLLPGVVEITHKEHSCSRNNCEEIVERNGIIVKVANGGFLFSHELASPLQEIAE